MWIYTDIDFNSYILCVILYYGILSMTSFEMTA